MVIVALIILGLCMGSFVNAFVWRFYQQGLDGEKTGDHTGKGREALHGTEKNRYSILKGRSMCPNCHHELAPRDLVPVLSWLALGGKCRYCKRPISWQYPLIELLTAIIFVASYAWWPRVLTGWEVISFALWLVVVIGLMALVIYDIRWQLLPNRIVFVLMAIAAVRALIEVVTASDSVTTLLSIALSALIGGGVFYIIFQLSAGKWIGGGDVKLGFLLGLMLFGAGQAFLMLFLASLMGCLVTIPLLTAKRLKATTKIPFGPFLIAATMIVVLFGGQILDWYTSTFLPVSV